jgi:hypothetical protein
MLRSSAGRYGVTWTRVTFARFTGAVGSGGTALVGLRYGVSELLKVIPIAGTPGLAGHSMQRSPSLSPLASARPPVYGWPMIGAVRDRRATRSAVPLPMQSKRRFGALKCESVNQRGLDADRCDNPLLDNENRGSRPRADLQTGARNAAWVWPRSADKRLTPAC